MEAIIEELKNEREFFKIYSFFIIGLITGISGIIISKIYTDKFVLILLMIGLIFLSAITIMFIITYIKIKKLTKTLKK